MLRESLVGTCAGGYPVGGAVAGVDWFSPFVETEGGTVLHVDLRADPARESLALEILDDSERRRCDRYMPAPRRRFMLCRAALRSLLCNYLGCPNKELTFPVTEFEKPVAQTGGKETFTGFNVSHSGDHGLIAISPARRIGVDVEEIAPKRHLASLVESVMGPEERAELGRLDEAPKLRQFFRLWTFKEALIKALGTGFATDISGFQVPENIRGGESTGYFRFPHAPSVTWRLEDLSTGDFAAALAYETDQ